MFSVLDVVVDDDNGVSVIEELKNKTKQNKTSSFVL